MLHPLVFMAPAHQDVHILVTDDDAAVLRMTAATLRRAGFIVNTALSGDEALAAIREKPDPIDVLLTDVMMPGMNGVELAREAQIIAPDLPILFMSGYAHIPTPGPVLSKPFRSSDLVAAIQSVLALRQ